MDLEYVQKKYRVAAFLLLGLMLLALIVPTSVAAQGLVPCGGAGDDPCTFTDLLLLVNNIINFIIFIAIPVSGALFAYAGFLYITDGGTGKNLNKAKGIFWNVVWGFIIVLGSWLLVKTIVISLANDKTEKFLQQFIDLR